MANIAAALRFIVHDEPDGRVVMETHPNPLVTRDPTEPPRRSFPDSVRSSCPTASARPPASACAPVDGVMNLHSGTDTPPTGPRSRSVIW